MHSRTASSHKKYALGLAALFAVYFATAWVGLRLAAVSGFAAPIWFPTGIAIAALMLYGKRYWPAIAAAAFLVNWATGAPPVLALFIAAGNTAEALVAFHLLRRMDFNPDFRWSRDVLLYAACVALGCTVVSATVGVTGLLASGIMPASAFLHTWVTWWVGDALGALVIAPLMMTWLRRPSTAGWRSRSPEIILLGSFTATLMLVIYVLPANPWIRGAYFSLLPLIWAALRFGARGATLTTFALSVFTIAATYYRHGPFGRVESLEAGLMHLQIFTGVASVTALIVSSLMAEKERSLQEIERINNALEKRLLPSDDRAGTARALRAAQERADGASAMNRALLNDRIEGVIVFDASGRLVAINASASRLVGKEPLSFFGPDGKKPLSRSDAPWTKALRSGSAAETEMTVVSNERPKGVLVWASGRRLRDEDGAAVGAAVTVRDAFSVASRAADSVVALAAVAQTPKE